MNKLYLIVFLGLVFLVFLAVIISLAFASFVPLNGEIAVIPIKGDIVSSSDSFSYSMTSAEIASKIKEADSDPLIKAIFLDIDSGGGSVVATKEIVYAVRETKKPVVAYIGEIGASGAYYVAAASDLIIADEDSLTGSIGVISMTANLEGLMEKLGIKMQVLKQGEFKDMGSPFKELTSEEEQLLNDIILQASVNFKNNILEFRKDKIYPEEFNKIADGRIMTGTQAKEIGLIDLTGSRNFAIKKTAELAGIKGEPVLKEFSSSQEDFFSLLSSAGYSFGSGFIGAVKANNSKFELQAK
jgi:protease-4